MSDSPAHRSRLSAAAGLLGAATAFTFIVGAGPAPSVFQLAGANEDVSGNCDEAEHANDPECGGTPGTTSSTIDDGSTTSTIDDTTSTTAAAHDVRTIDAAGAGTVVVGVDGNRLRLVAATPAPGWRVEVEQSAGREIEVDFRNGTKRVQVNVEIEDGVVRERVRVRDDADGTDIRIEDGTIVRDDSDDQADNSGPGSSNSGPDSDDDSDDDDHSGSGHDGSDDDDSGDDSGDDDGSSGHGSDDDSSDDDGHSQDD